jgi:hypothetical protein
LSDKSNSTTEIHEDEKPNTVEEEMDIEQPSEIKKKCP